MSATIRIGSPNTALATLKNGVWTSEIEGLALLLNGEMLSWKWERPTLNDLEQDKVDALHMIEKFFPDHGELIEFTPPSTKGHPSGTIY